MTDIGQSDCEVLMNDTLASTKDMLREQGGLVPFAQTMADDGAIELVAVEDDGEPPAAREVIAMLKAALGQGAAQGRRPR